MDSDSPSLSIEKDGLPSVTTTNIATTSFLASPSLKVNHYESSLNHGHTHSNLMDPAAQVPLPPSSPMRSPYHSPNAAKTKALSPKPPSRSPSVASSYRGEGQHTSPLRRSDSSLSNIRGSTPQFRRASSNLNPLASTINGKMPQPECPPVTANSVAKDYFAKELEAHASLQTPTVVIVHDSCYGHRFSRPRATKNALATIVERPERIHATLLGASAAYVRLGDRHADGKFAPRAKHDPTQVRNVPFQIRKTSRIIPLTHPSVAFVHGAKWMEELQIMCDTAEGKLALNGKELVRPVGYGKDETGQALPKLHEGDLYLCAESLAAFQGCLGGVCDAVDTVFSSSPTKRAFVCIRPPGHHCSSDYPSGFCWLNNVHVGIAYAAMSHGLTHAAIIDFDLHHGDGSQNIAWDQNQKAHTAAKNAAQHKKTPIGYYSLHDINSYPCEWGDEEKVQKASLCIENAHGQSIWNVHLESWQTREEFWKLYESKYTVLLQKARHFLRHHTAKIRAAGGQQPKAAIFISAGFDASEWEGAGMQRHSVNVPTEFYARFTADIAKLAQEDDLGVGGRVISVLEGGYSDRALTSGVLSHVCGLAGDTITTRSEDASMNGDKKYRTINNWMDNVNGTSGPSYSTDWWALQNLEELEYAVSGRRPTTANIYQDKTGDYASPTQASTLKMTEHARERQSYSSLQARLSMEAKYESPPPDVDWATAAYELSRVIIPHDRQTLSCTHEELNAEATKARRERQSGVGVSSAPSEEPMQLRVRKAKAQPIANPAARAVSRTSNRRTTIAAVSDLPDPTLQQSEMPYSRMRRRSSDASSILSSFQGMKLSDEAKGEPPGFSRTASSRVSSRAPSVIPEQVEKLVAVKKTRAPAATKVSAKPKTSPRKVKAPIPPVPALPSTATQGRPTLDFNRQSSSASQGGVKVAAKPDDMDTLTNGVKKISIKLKVPPVEENPTDPQPKVPDQKWKKPRAPRKPPVPKAVKPSAITPATNINNAATQPKPFQAENQQPIEPAVNTTIPASREENILATQPPALVPKTEPFYPKDGNDMDPPYVAPQTAAPVPAGPGSIIPPTHTVQSVYNTYPPRLDRPMYNAYPPTPNPSDASVPPLAPVAAVTNPAASVSHYSVPQTAAPDPYLGFHQPESFSLQNNESNGPAPYKQPNTDSVPTAAQRTKEDLPVFTSSSPIPFAAQANKEFGHPEVKKENAETESRSDGI